MESGDSTEKKLENSVAAENTLDNTVNLQSDAGELHSEIKSMNISDENPNSLHDQEGNDTKSQALETSGLESENREERKRTMQEILAEEEAEPVFDGTETPRNEANRSSFDRFLHPDQEGQGYAWTEKAVAVTNFVKEKGSVAVSSVLRRLSGKTGEDGQTVLDSKGMDNNSAGIIKKDEGSSPGSKSPEAFPKTGERSTWNPLSYIKIMRDIDVGNKTEQGGIVAVEDSAQEPIMKGRVILYTRLGCQESKGVRYFLHVKRIKFIEINIDIYPSRKLELEKRTGSPAVPKIFFNDHLVAGLSELKSMDESGKLDKKMNDLVNEEPPPEAPLPPLSGEDDMSGTGVVDESAIIVRKMRESIVVKDRFYKMRMFANCFLGSEAVDFLSEDQYLEREEAVEFGRKLATKYLFRHVLDENIFEDGDHLYRFLDHDPLILSQCYNIPRGILDVIPKPVVEISSRLRFLLFAMYEAYVSEDGRHVDYRSIQSSEEFARYLRVVEELQRVELDGLSREETLAFFINLYNMMAIHAILTWGYPVGALDRRKLLGDFKYVVGGYTYSLSSIQNGILRGNQRPPYNLLKPFGLRDRRSKVSLPYPDPLIHFALVCGNRSGPALRCYSPGNIDTELMEAARNFMRNGGLVIDTETKVASVNKILRWYSGDFGRNELEVLKHAANYLEPPKSEELLELLANTQLKVIYQPYDWSPNC